MPEVRTPGQNVLDASSIIPRFPFRNIPVPRLSGNHNNTRTVEAALNYFLYSVETCGAQMVMELCSNCDHAAASYMCEQCLSDNLFCSDCHVLHNKIKAFRNHKLRVLNFPRDLICCNCEENEAKFMCKHCESDCVKYLCVGCSVIHPKVKTFRGHVVVAIKGGVSTQTKSNLGRLLGSISNVMEWCGGCFTLAKIDETGEFIARSITRIYDDVTNRSVTDPIFWQTLVLVLAGSLSYYMTIRFLFDRYASLINIGIATLIYRWSRMSKNSSVELRGPAAVTAAGESSSKGKQSISFADGTKAPASSSNAGGGARSQDSRDDFSNEFWHSGTTKRSATTRATAATVGGFLGGGNIGGGSIGIGMGAVVGGGGGVGGFLNDNVPKQATYRPRGRPYRPRTTTTTTTTSSSSSSSSSNQRSPRLGDSESDDMRAAALINQFRTIASGSDSGTGTGASANTTTATASTSTVVQ